MGTRLKAMPQRKRWYNVKGAISGLIAQLLTIGWDPEDFDGWVDPWHRTWTGVSRESEHLGPITRAIQRSVQRLLLQQAGGFEEHGRGIEQGIDCYQMQLALRRLRRTGRQAEAAMLETVATGAARARDRWRRKDLVAEEGFV